VTAFDFAPNAVAKAKGLAQRRNVKVRHEFADAYTWPWAAERYDALVAVFIQFLPPDFRDSVFSGMKSAVEDGGLFLLEGYRPEQSTTAPAVRRAVNICIRASGSKACFEIGRSSSQRITTQ
jgi:hypothetical protein